MSIVYILVIAAVLVGIFMMTGCATRKPMRPTLGHRGDPPREVKPADAWYIQSVPESGQKPFSCSFVEFDERGDYLDFRQHRHAYAKIRELARQGERLMVLIYVHGWKNNAQSGDVVKFNNFLRQVASSPLAQQGKFRVHGVYLGWRGNAFPHALSKTSESFAETQAAFGGEPVVNLRYARNRWLGWLWFVPEQLSYWQRKGAAEDKVSGVSIIRTIFTCGHTARRYQNTNEPNRVFLLGHSFGALMLEQSFAPASLSRLTQEWPWDDPDATKRASANPLPFDLVMFVNSAAPSIYAKQLHGYMVAHREALANNQVIGADAPLIISLTTAADWATGVTHKYGNFFARFYPSLWRSYDGSDFILRMDTNDPPVTIPQAFYYRRTPGHNPLLVNHWIVPAKEAVQAPTSQSKVHQNIDTNRTAEVKARTFTTSARKGGKEHIWQITSSPPDPKWTTYHGYDALCVGPRPVRSGYWIVRCQKEISGGHNDIWSQQAMETYAALLRETEYLRTQKPE